jgi:hypothetical protein
MKRTRLWATLVLFLVGATGCGGGHAAPGSRVPTMAPARGGATYADGPAQKSAAPMEAEPGGYDAPPASATSAPAPRYSGGSSADAAGEIAPMPAAPPRDEERAAAPTERPGLATEWGETRYSHVSTAAFVRADRERPMVVAKLFYNDYDGSRRMAAASGYRPLSVGATSVAGDGITVELHDERGEPLAGFIAGGRTYAIGEAGRRYTIVITNHTGYRFEAVASVDGLDVIDGRPASFEKRGYLVAPWATVEIDGFRQSDDAVAAFRFGSVADSYAARTGSDRNVGVVGVAFFHERGYPAWPWTDDEIRRRNSADPFPGQYATPPPPRW